MEFIPSEHEEQKAVIEWVLWNQNKYPELRLLFAVPNGGHRNKIVAAKLKAEGVKPGVPDLILPVARCEYHGLAIEMKRRKGWSLSNDQEWWIHSLNEQKYKAIICKGADEAIKALTEYLDGTL